MVRRAHASLGQAPLPQPASARAQTWHTHSTRHALRNYPNLPRARIPAAFLHITLCTFLYTHHLALPEGPGLIQRLPSSLPRGALTPYAQDNTRTRTTDTTAPPPKQMLLPQQQIHFLAIRRRSQNPRCSPTLPTTTLPSYRTAAANMSPRPETDKNTTHSPPLLILTTGLTIPSSAAQY